MREFLDKKPDTAAQKIFVRWTVRLIMEIKQIPTSDAILSLPDILGKSGHTISWDLIHEATAPLIHQEAPTDSDELVL
jgi:hypothetical protein